MVSMEEQLTEALERVKLLEQERDAFKTPAKEEEVARITAVSLLKKTTSRRTIISHCPRRGRASRSEPSMVLFFLLTIVVLSHSKSLPWGTPC